jgi:TATA-box binding protein (TBP) (component of TFIID and TFIIIB)
MEATAKFLLDVSRVRKSFPKELRPSWLKITTITMVANIGKPFNLEAMREAIGDGIDMSLGPGASRTFNWTLTPTKFMNQITVGYTDDRSKKSIKLFPNGAVQVAGCSDLIDCSRIRDQLNVLIKEFNPEGVFIKEFEIVMINTNFTMSHRLDLFNKVITEFSDYPLNFRPEEYSGVIIKVPSTIPGDKPVTVSIFASGAVIVTGAQRLGEIASAYRKVATRLQKCILPDKPNEKKKFTMFGHPITQLVKAYQKKYEPTLNVDEIRDVRREVHDSCDKQSALKRASYAGERPRVIRQLQL